jgi:hypothetical protein
MGPGVDSSPNINEYQDYFLGGKSDRFVWLATLPLSHADCLEIWEPQTLGILRACPGLHRDLITFYMFQAQLTIIGLPHNI